MSIDIHDHSNTLFDRKYISIPHTSIKLADSCVVVAKAEESTRYAELMFTILLAGPCSFTALVMLCVPIAVVAVDIDQLSFLRLDFPGMRGLAWGIVSRKLNLPLPCYHESSTSITYDDGTRNAKQNNALCHHIPGPKTFQNDHNINLRLASFGCDQVHHQP